MARVSPQRIIKTRRAYNTWVANELMEDYALRYAPRHFRKWTEASIANTALGAVSFLVLEAIGGSLTVSFGFVNAIAAIVVVGLLVFITGLPIGYYAAKYNLDMDLLTRGAGFGYIGSTLTSLIYASFTFIFFALEAAIMSLALEMCCDIPLAMGYVLSSLVILPLVTHGITWISKLQAWTQPIWIVLMILPYAFVLHKDPTLLRQWTDFAGNAVEGNRFTWLGFGAACSVAFSLIAQIGEQVDYLRFLPEQNAQNRGRWWTANLAAGAGWILPGMLKQFGGAFLAFVAIRHGVPMDRAVEPTHMYLVGFEYVFNDSTLALLAMTLFVVISQVKINVTNAYAGSLAWSNFFSRLTHTHPGRVTWLVFNVLIALLLMELGVFSALQGVLGLYSNIAIAWVGALVADLLINKPLGLSPNFIEFKRAHLFDINPVGVGSMLLASMLSIMAHFGLFGILAQAFAPFIALLTALLFAPLIAWLTQGRFYVARPQVAPETVAGCRCSVCDLHYESEDKTYCPVYEGTICSLCCSLDVRCGDACKPSARLTDQLSAVADRLLPSSWSARLRVQLSQYVLLFVMLAGLAGVAMSIIYYQELVLLDSEISPRGVLGSAFVKLYAVLLVLLGIATWWLVLTNESRRAAQNESNKQTQLLLKEIADHKKTDTMLHEAKESADQANRAKSRFLSDMSHELRNPLNSVLGYSEILLAERELPERHREAVGIIKQSGEHLLSLIDDVLDIARIEARKFHLKRQTFAFPAFLAQICNPIKLEAARKGLVFKPDFGEWLPHTVRGDEQRVRQILLNLLGNAVKFTNRGSIEFSVRYASEIAVFEIRDTGVGIADSDIERIFQPFQRADSGASIASEGNGLGLTISKILTEIMGGELCVSSQLRVGSTFRVRLFLPSVAEPVAASTTDVVTGYAGPAYRLLVTDDQPAQRNMLASLLGNLGFEVELASSGEACLAAVQERQPDLVLLDLNMPGMGGLAALREMRACSMYSGPVIIVSANAFDLDRQEAEALGATDYIVKPVRLNVLKEKLKQYLHVEWHYEDGIVDAAVAAELEAGSRSEPERPDGETVEALIGFAKIGYVQGISEVLDELTSADSERFGPFVRIVGRLARQYRFREVLEYLEQE